MFKSIKKEHVLGTTLGALVGLSAYNHIFPAFQYAAERSNGNIFVYIDNLFASIGITSNEVSAVVSDPNFLNLQLPSPIRDRIVVVSVCMIAGYCAGGIVNAYSTHRKNSSSSVDQNNQQ